jgi:uncharacterized membrane protein YqjE
LNGGDPGDRDLGEAPGPIRQLIGSISGLFATLISMGRTRLELLSVELREEVNRTAELLAWGLVALLGAAGTLLFAGFAIIVAFWDSHRTLAAVLVTAAWLALAAFAALRVRGQLRSRPPFLGATLAELRRDEDHLRGSGS